MHCIQGLNKILKHVFFLLIFTNAFANNIDSDDKLWRKFQSSKDSNTSALILIELSENCYKEDKNKSEKIALQALQLSKKHANKKTIALALMQLTNVYFDNGKYEDSYFQAEELLKIIKEINDPKIYSEAYRIIGRRHHFRGDYASALEFYLKGLRYFENINDSIQTGEIYNTIGGVYLNQSDLDKAFYYYNKSLQIQLKKNNKLRIGRGYLNIANVYIAKKELKKAKTALDNSLFNYNLINSFEGKSLVYATLSEIFIEKQMPDSAIQYLLISHNYLTQINKFYPITQIDLNIAKLYLANKNYQKALYYLNEGIDIGIKTKQNHNLTSLFKLKSEVLEQAGDLKESFLNYKLYKQFSDSVLNASSIKKQVEDALKYDFSKKEYQQKLEKQKVEIIEKEEASKRKLILIYSCIFIGIIFLLLYYRYRLKQKANKKLAQAYSKLEQKNIIIQEKTKALEESLGERELLLKEIHHRVKNNLQIISGLLELQKEELTEAGSKAAFNEGQSRVKSISLIHQNLYQNDNLGSIQFKSFVKDLCSQVQDVFEQLDRKIEVSIEMPDKIFDIDTAVPLGLIINELLTNSYKYATEKNKLGLIDIVLKDKENGDFILIYSDNGKGIKEDIDFENSTTLGLRLIKGLSSQLGGMASYSNINKSTFTIIFKDTPSRSI